MKTLILTIAVMVASLAVMAYPVSAATSNGPYYATPSWDQQLDPSVRFIVLSNWGGAAVLDRETGLVWEQSPSTSLFFWIEPSSSTAARHCNVLTVGNRQGWRLPTLQELASLVDPSVPFPGPTLPPGNPFNAPASFYWSATTNGTFSGDAWGVNFLAGVADIFNKGNQGRVWCVRGGQGVDPQ